MMNILISQRDSFYCLLGKQVSTDLNLSQCLTFIEKWLSSCNTPESVSHSLSLQDSDQLINGESPHSFTWGSRILISNPWECSRLFKWFWRHYLYLIWASYLFSWIKNNSENINFSSPYLEHICLYGLNIMFPLVSASSVLIFSCRCVAFYPRSKLVNVVGNISALWNSCHWWNLTLIDYTLQYTY